MLSSERSELNTPHEPHSSHLTNWQKVNLAPDSHAPILWFKVNAVLLCWALTGAHRRSAEEILREKRSEVQKAKYRMCQKQRERRCRAGPLSTQPLPAMFAWLVPRAWRISCSSLTATAASSPQHKSGSRTTSSRPTPTKERWVTNSSAKENVA